MRHHTKILFRKMNSKVLGLPTHQIYLQIYIYTCKIITTTPMLHVYDLPYIAVDHHLTSRYLEVEIVQSHAIILKNGIGKK